MGYHFENLKLEKGMYGRSGVSFTQTLEELDPSENYRGTPLEGLDAFQRQLKRFDIKVKGIGSDRVEKFFHTTDSAVLFPEFVSRVVRQGLEEGSILPDITATVTNFDGMDALLSTVMMPSGIPVATVAVDGAKNAALLAIEILAVTDEALAEKLAAARKKETDAVLAKDAELRAKYH